MDGRHGFEVPVKTSAKQRITSVEVLRTSVLRTPKLVGPKLEELAFPSPLTWWM